MPAAADPAEHERFRFFATQHLGELFAAAEAGGRTEGATRLRTALRGLLASDRHDLVRRQALLSLGRQGDEMALAAMERALKAPGDGPLVDPAMRVALLRDRADLVPHLRRRAYAEDLFVRRQAVACLGEVSDEASRPACAAAAAHDDAALAAAGKLALERLDAAATAKETP